MKQVNQPIGSLGTFAKSFAVLIAMACFASNAAAMICEAQGSEVIVDIEPADEVMKSAGLQIAKAKAGDAGTFRFKQKDNRTLTAALNSDKKCVISIGFQATKAIGNIDAATIDEIKKSIIADLKEKKVAEEAKTENDAKLKKLIVDGREDLGVPSSPALSLIGIDPSKATLPKTPKDISAALASGRGADGKIKAGVTIDASFAQLFEASKTILGLTSAADCAASASKSKSGSGKPELSKVSLADYGLTANEVKYYKLLICNQIAPNLLGGDDSPQRTLNRLKISIATTEDKDTTKPATDLSLGMHYVVFDKSDPLTANCDGKNSEVDGIASKTVTSLLKARDATFNREITPLLLRELKKGRLNSEAIDIVKEGLLAPVLAACSLNAEERIAASAFMIGLAKAYRLTEGNFASRQSGARGFWLTYASPSFGGEALRGQAILHLRATRDMPIDNPVATSTVKTVLSSENLQSIRLRGAGTKGAAFVEYSRLRNWSQGITTTKVRQAIGLEWKIAEGVWLVGSGGTEKDQTGAKKGTPFVITNLRFGGSPSVPKAFGE